MAIGNLKLHYEQAGDWQSEKDILLLIHGLGSSMRDWENQVQALRTDYRVLTIDLRGHGQSDKPNMPYHIPLFAEDVVSLIKEFKMDALHVVGHSMGGMTAFQLTLDHPHLVKTLTIINSGPQVVFPRIRNRLHFAMRVLSVKCFGMIKVSESIAKAVFPKAEQVSFRTTLIKRWCENDPQAYINSLKAFQKWDVLDRLHEIMCPTLIISGDRDYSPVAYKEFYMKFIKNAQLVVIDDSGHFSLIDQVQKCNQAIIDFLLKNKGTI